MQLDSKHRVLYAIYAEYQKDLPDMMNVSHESLDMEVSIFQMALIKLQNEGFIDGLVIVPPDTVIPRKVKAINRENVLPTRLGVEYVENNLEVQRNLSSQEKLESLKCKFGKLGWGVLQETVVKIIAEMI